MIKWDWNENTWACGECDASDNHALANFCARCGDPIADKAASVAAPISPLEDCPIEEHVIPLANPDVLLNIFGVALVVEKASGNATAFPDPLRESRSFELPRLDNEIAQVGFDPWWVYVLDIQGALFVFPTSALSDEPMARNTGWRRCAEKVRNFWPFKDRLLVLGEEDRQIKMGEIPSVTNWADGEIDYEPKKMETPFEVETLVPLQGGDFQAMLVGNDKMALLSDKGVSESREVSLDGGHWIGSNRGDMPRLATRLGNGEIGVVSFQPLHQGIIPDLRAIALDTVDIDGQAWFVAVTSDGIHLIDPLSRGIRANYKVFMKRADMCTSFGNLVAGFQDNADPARSQMLAVFRFDRDGISRLYAESLKAGLSPVTAPAGFGNRVYVMIEESNMTKLHCYSLGGGGRA